MTNGEDTMVRDASTNREKEAREADNLPDIRWKWGFEDLETGGMRATVRRLILRGRERMMKEKKEMSVASPRT